MPSGPTGDPPGDPPGDSKNETLTVQIANQIINVANARLKDGVHPQEAAAGLRHAAANFSAFVSQQGAGVDSGLMVEEFARLLEFYLGRHAPADNPAGGLKNLSEQVKGEF